MVSRFGSYRLLKLRYGVPVNHIGSHVVKSLMTSLMTSHVGFLTVFGMDDTLMQKMTERPQDPH